MTSQHAMSCVICVEDAPLAASVKAAVQAFTETKQCGANDVAAVAPRDALLIIDEKNLSALSQPPAAVALGISGGSIADNVELLARHQWLSQLGTPEVFQGAADGIKWMVHCIAQQQPGLGLDTLNFLGKDGLHARRVLFYRSTDIEKRLDRLTEFATSVGARSRAVEQLHDITNELLVNALYDAPYEAGYLNAPPPRQHPIELPADMPCELVYGTVDNEIFVRVRDCFGALTRERLMEVLLRCARGANSVELDESRGGAGLGMWRIFRQSSRVIVAVSPGTSTEMLITVPKTGVLKKNLRTWHFLFEKAPRTA